MSSELAGLLDDLEYYARQLDAVGTVMVDLARSKRRRDALVSEAVEVYQLLTLDLSDTYNALKRAYRKSGQRLGARGGPVLEAMENAFVILRDSAESAAARTEKMESIGGRKARAAKASAEAIALLAENAAKVLVAEAEKAGRWTVEWERELGLRRWLR